MDRTIALEDALPAAPRVRRRAAPVVFGKPDKWWQWLMIYPTLGISLVTATPQWADKATLYFKGINQQSVAVAEQQNRLWLRNVDCAKAADESYIPKTLEVQATVCPSGDIFVRAATPANQKYYKWIGIEDVVRPPSAVGNPLIPAAQAAPKRLAVAGATVRAQGAAPPVRLAYMQASVICQRFLDQRMMLRRVQTPQGCFDEIVDTFNGQVVRRNPAPCAPC